MPEPDVINVALSKYTELRARLGRKPSSREFYKEFSKKKLSGAFEGGRCFSRLQELAGDTPNRFSSEKSDLRSVLLQWGGLARRTLKDFGKLPIQSDWAHNGLTPSVSGIEKSHKIKWSALPRLFRDEFSSVPEWQDVIAAIPVTSPTRQADRKHEECSVYLMKDLRNGKHKIGISSNPGRRERTLQSEQPKTELVAHKKFVNRKMASAMEKALHETYSHKRERGEWFSLDEEDLKEIRATLDEEGN